MSALSLCKKAGKLVTGFDAVCESMAAGEAFILLFAQDVSEKTSKRVMAKNNEEIPTYILPTTMEQISAVTFRPVGVIAVTEKNLATLCEGAIKKTLSQSYEEEPI